MKKLTAAPVGRKVMLLLATITATAGLALGSTGAAQALGGDVPSSAVQPDHIATDAPDAPLLEATSSASALVPQGTVPAPDSSKATPLPAFIIYYGLNCATAGRFYQGINAGEKWINDTFTYRLYSSVGYGQLIRKNAASIYVYPSSVITVNYGDSNDIVSEDDSEGCHNLYLRNSNTSWSARNG